jgi:hypothetical protein
MCVVKFYLLEWVWMEEAVAYFSTISAVTKGPEEYHGKPLSG